MSKVVVIDPGHGDHDPGATAYGLKEKDVVLDIAKLVRTKLNKYKGVKVIMTRTTDKFLSLSERANIANRNNADVFVSIHINAGKGTGYEDYIYNGSVSNNTHKLQDSIHSEIMKQINVTDRGKKRANFAVVRQTAMPAVLTENLFIDRKSDANKLKSSSFLNKVAEGHAKGIAKYLGLKKNKGGLTVSEKERLKKAEEKITKLEKQLKKKVSKPAQGKVSSVHEENWEWGHDEGITKQSNPLAYVRYEQIISLLKNLHDEIKPTYQKPGSSHEEAWNKMVELDLITDINPHHPVTRAQLATILDRAGVLDKEVEIYLDGKEVAKSIYKDEE